MAIFYSIVEDRVAPTANIFTQVNTLCNSLKFFRLEPTQCSFKVISGARNDHQPCCLYSLYISRSFGDDAIKVEFTIVKPLQWVCNIQCTLYNSNPKIHENWVELYLNRVVERANWL